MLLRSLRVDFLFLSKFQLILRLTNSFFRSQFSFKTQQTLFYILISVNRGFLSYSLVEQSNVFLGEIMLDRLFLFLNSSIINNKRLFQSFRCWISISISLILVVFISLLKDYIVRCCPYITWFSYYILFLRRTTKVQLSFSIWFYINIFWTFCDFSIRLIEIINRRIITATVPQPKEQTQQSRIIKYSISTKNLESNKYMQIIELFLIQEQNACTLQINLNKARHIFFCKECISPDKSYEAYSNTVISVSPDIILYIYLLFIVTNV